MTNKAREAITDRAHARSHRMIACLNDLHQKYRDLDEGRVADYIPELAKANRNWFGISVVGVDGQIYEVGDYEQQFTIQSASKPFTFGLVLDEYGREYTKERVGVEPTGDAFNSVIKLDIESNRPHNPMVNAGAIAMTSQIPGSDSTERLNTLLEMFENYVGHKVHMDMAVFMSERTTGDRNRAIAYLMRNFGMIRGDIDQALDLYFQQCSMLVTCSDLATMAATLANNGVNPVTGVRAIQSEYVSDVLSVMFSCGMYDYAGEWAYTVGVPAKSGIGGALFMVVPQHYGIAIFSPPLDQRGNSVRGINVCRDLSEIFNLHVFKRMTETAAIDADDATAEGEECDPVVPIRFPS